MRRSTIYVGPPDKPHLTYCCAPYEASTPNPGEGPHHALSRSRDGGGRKAMAPGPLPSALEDHF